MSFAASFDKVFDSIVKALAHPQINFACTRADDVFGGGHIIEDILKGIGSAEIIIADVTNKNPNVFYELGIAHMVKNLGNVIILTQSMDDVPFDLRPFRCIVYTQSPGGLKVLRGRIRREVEKLFQETYRFSVALGQQYKFPDKVFGIGEDRCGYDFDLVQLMMIANGAKFRLKVYQHAVGRKTKTVFSAIEGLKESEGLMLPYTPRRLVLERVSPRMAEFCLLPADGE